MPGLFLNHLYLYQNLSIMAMTKEGAAKRRELEQKKVEAIRARFTYLHDKKRLRIDDCITKLSEEFFLTEGTIERKLNMK